MASTQSVTRMPVGAYFGRHTWGVEVAGFRLTESSYQPGESLPPHTHAQAHFIAVLSGRYAETIGRLRAQRAPGATLFLPPDVPHEERHHTTGRHFMIELQPEVLNRLRERPGDFSYAVDLPSDKAARVTRRLYAELRAQDESSPLVIEGLILLLLTLVTRQSERDRPGRPAFLDEARQYIHDHLARSFTIEQLAGLVGVNRWELARAFQKHLGCSPGEYLRQQRLEAARLELARPGRSLAAVAHAAGFYDQSHFSRVFKSWTGVTPGFYQRQIAGDARTTVE